MNVFCLFLLVCLSYEMVLLVIFVISVSKSRQCLQYLRLLSVLYSTGFYLVTVTSICVNLEIRVCSVVAV